MKFLAMNLFFLLLATPVASFAVEDKAGTTAAAAEVEAAKPAEEESGGFISGYLRIAERRADEISKLDMWGQTLQLPKGILKLQYKVNPQRANTRRDREGNVTPIIPRIAFDDESGQNILAFDANAKGGGMGHTFQISYGILGNFDYYLELPFQQVTTSLHPTYRRGPAPLPDDIKALAALAKAGNLDTEEDFYKFMSVMGRPQHVNDKWAEQDPEWKSGMELGDMHTGFSWNFYRTEYFSTSLTGRVFLPTGRVANPDRNIFFLLGPELDAGTGSWAIGCTQGYDFRLPEPLKFLTFYFELSTAYYFESDRPSPHFETPVPVALGVITPDQLPAEFPDLSNMGGTYKYTPGLSVDGMVSIAVDVFGVGMGVAYSFARAEKPVITASNRETPSTTVPDSAYSFERWVDAMELIGEQSVHTFGASVSVPLFSFYVPAILAFEGKWNLGGANNLIMKDNYSLTTQLFFPLF